MVVLEDIDGSGGPDLVLPDLTAVLKRTQLIGSNGSGRNKLTLNRAIGIGYLRKLPRDCFCPVNGNPIDLGGSESGIMGHVIDRWAMNQQVFVSPGLDRWFRASDGARQQAVKLGPDARMHRRRSRLPCDWARSRSD